MSLKSSDRIKFAVSVHEMQCYEVANDLNQALCALVGECDECCIPEWLDFVKDAPNDEFSAIIKTLQDEYDTIVANNPGYEGLLYSRRYDY